MESSSGNCGKCGICLTVCPVFKVLKEEQASPRARIQLIRAYENNCLPSSPLLKELISKCLMCGSCAATCPSGVDHYSKFMEMRSQLIENHGDRLEIRGLVYLLAKEQRLRFAMGMARIGQGVLPGSITEKYKLADIKIKDFPRLNKKSFRSAVGDEIAPKGEERGTVLYFTGCATNYIYDETGFATVELLTAMGFRVIIPSKQTCCSIPMLYHGGVEEARRNIETNIDALQNDLAEAVIVDCPTCGSALKNEFPGMMKKFGLDETEALKIAAKTTDLMSFIHAHPGLLEFKKNEVVPDGAVTYHVPCHLKNSFVSAERVLQAIPEIDYVPAVDAAECCGGGGTFFYEYPEVAEKMSASKIENARETGASVWLTDCPVCRINLAGRLEPGEKIMMMHPAVYLQRLMSGENNG